MVQRQYRLNFAQPLDEEGEVLGKALTETVMQGLRRVVMNYDLMMAVHSNSFRIARQQSPKNIPFAEWLSNGEYKEAWMEQLAKRLNSGEVMDMQQDGFFVELTFIRRLGLGGKGDGKKCNPGRMAWEKCQRNNGVSFPSRIKMNLAAPAPLLP